MLDLKKLPVKLVNITLLAVSGILCMFFLEIGLRIFFSGRLDISDDKNNLGYQYDSQLGWFPVKNSEKSYFGSKKITVRHNKRGFRDIEHVITEKPRIVFIGDSFVWGYDVEAKDRFTEKLRMLIPDWTVYNLGVSGYGTDQEYLLCRRHFEFYTPDIVFLIYCADNDRGNNSTNLEYSGYYKPYFKTASDGLELKGVPTPKNDRYFFSIHPVLSLSYLVRLGVLSYYNLKKNPVVLKKNPTHSILMEFNRYVESKGAVFLVGIEGTDPEIEVFLEEKNFAHVYLKNEMKYEEKGGHWTPAGHEYVAKRILDFLQTGDYLKKSEK